MNERMAENYMAYLLRSELQVLHRARIGCQVQEFVFNPVGKWKPMKIFKPGVIGSELCIRKVIYEHSVCEIY